jgi:iron complex outermembrane receptor protein
LANTDQSSSAPQVDERNQGVFTTFTDGKKYNDILPSLNLSFDLGNTGVVRVAAARQMARARMDQMYAGRRYSIDSTSSTWTGSGGNPKLDPFRANAFDVSYEKYFGTKAYVAAAAFYKSLSSYVFDYTDTAYNFSGVVAAPGQTVPPTVIGRFSQPRNGKGGKISGVELTASLPLNMATAMLDGFGVEVSFASTTSAIKPFGDADSRSLPGLSRKVSKVTAYYEKFGFGARIAQRSRSDFLGEIQGFGAGRSYQYIKGESITDLQLSYEFQTGMAKGLSFLLQVNNLGDAKYQEYKDTPSNITNTVKYGKTYLFGANYKF